MSNGVVRLDKEECVTAEIPLAELWVTYQAENKASRDNTSHPKHKPTWKITPKPPVGGNLIDRDQPWDQNNTDNIHRPHRIVRKLPSKTLQIC